MQRVAVVGYGNIGQYAVEAIRAASDMELAGVVWRRAGTEQPTALNGVPVVRDIDELKQVDAALLCLPSNQVEAFAQSLLARGIHTVDSFDMHPAIPALRTSLDACARANGAVAVVAAGWDPGSDSVIRALLQAIAPRGITHTNFGPGMSMGHTVAAKAVDGVAHALSVTVPLGSGLHRRNVYVQLKEGADATAVEQAIKTDPYYCNDETHVFFVADVAAVTDRGHGVLLTRRGVSGITDNQVFSFEMRINNPALTAQVMTACARAAMRQKPGAYTMIEIPVIDLLPGDRDAYIRALV